MDMKTKFTEGEWLVEQCDLPITESEYFNINAVSGGCIADTYNKHDAALIAAAPDMYKMIDDLTIELKHAIDEVNGSRMMQINSQTETPPDMWDMQSLHEAQLLLKKARGES